MNNTRFCNSGGVLLPTVIAWLTVVRMAMSDDHELLAIIAEAGPQGAGSVSARSASDELRQRGADFLPSLLIAMDTSNPVAANWYRTVFETIVARELTKKSTQWPIDVLKEYLSDSRREGRPRRLVLKLINRLEPGFEEVWLRERLSDPEFRRDAVAQAINVGDGLLREGDTAGARIPFRNAFEYARESEQVTQSAERLRSVGETADVIKHLGLVTDWRLAGPFDAPGKSGFSLVFEPESRLEPEATYRGQNESEFGWIRHQSEDPLGQINLVTVLGKTDEAVAYAWTEIVVEKEHMAQLRCSADDCCVVWVNDLVVSSHEQWLNGTRFDRFSDSVKLMAGRNTILAKVCQGPQHRDPEVFNNWSLQLRLCDDEGRGISFETALPAIEPEQTTGGSDER